ncbi:MAG: FxLYD domain-containing protein, partial [Chloroflexi bacterium]|nr:FxLYD domain-containing protein [Chloroflexota bacterium]
ATPTPTPTPTRDPSAPETTDLVAAPGLSLALRSESALADPRGHVHLWGELENRGDAPIADIELTVTLYDEHGVFWKVERAQPTLPVIPPGDVSPYEVLTGPAFLPDGSTWRIEVAATPIEAFEAPPISLVSGAVESNLTGRSVFVGTLRNDGAEPEGPLIVSVALYDGDGVIVNEAFGTVRGQIAPGASIEVRFGTFDKPARDAVSHRVQVQRAP